MMEPRFDPMPHADEITRDVEAVLDELCRAVKPLKRYKLDIRAALFRIAGSSAQLGYREASTEAVIDRAMLLGRGDFTVID